MNFFIGAGMSIQKSCQKPPKLRKNGHSSSDQQLEKILDKVLAMVLRSD